MRELSLFHRIEQLYDSESLVSHFLMLCAQEMEDSGLKFYISNDFDRYYDVAREKQDSWFAPMPIFTEWSKQPGEGFWLRGADASDKTIMVQAARRLELWRSNLYEAVTSLRVFYGEPERMAGPNEKFVCNAPSAKGIAGRVCYSGGIWIDPEHRRGRLVAVSARMSRALALLQWRTDYTLSFVEPWLVEKGVVQKYGYKNIEKGLRWCNNPEQDGDVVLNLIFMNRTELLEDLAEAMALGAKARLSPATPLPIQAAQ